MSTIPTETQFDVKHTYIQIWILLKSSHFNVEHSNTCKWIEKIMALLA